MLAMHAPHAGTLGSTGTQPSSSTSSLTGRTRSCLSVGPGPGVRRRRARPARHLAQRAVTATVPVPRKLVRTPWPLNTRKYSACTSQSAPRWSRVTRSVTGLGVAGLGVTGCTVTRRHVCTACRLCPIASLPAVLAFHTAPCVADCFANAANALRQRVSVAWLLDFGATIATWVSWVCRFGFGRCRCLSLCTHAPG